MIVGVVIYHYQKEAGVSVVQEIKNLFFAVCRRFHIKLSYHFWYALVLLKSGCWIFLQWLPLTWLKDSREDLKKASGSLCEDSEWDLVKSPFCSPGRRYCKTASLKSLVGIDITQTDCGS